MNNIVNVQEIRRNVINVVRNYSDAQVKVRKATSNEPWGPSATLMAEIADLTYNVVAFSEIMQIIWKRLNDHGKNWRHVYKALVLLEYLIKTGSEKVAQQCRDNLFAIQTLKDFQYFDESKDQGLSIREKSKILVNLLKDEEKLKQERSRALKAKERFTQSISYMGNGSDGGEQAFRQSSSYPESLSQSDTLATTRSLNSDLESDRPKTAGEEKLQLELALAVSKEEAEQEERLRKNDELRLKLALEESEKNANKSKPEPVTSAVDELLSLAGPSGLSNGQQQITATDPWGSPITTTTNNTTTLPTIPPASLLPSPPMNTKHHKQQTNTTITNNTINHNDPWSAPVINNNSREFDDKPSTTTTSFDDPWAPGGSINTSAVGGNNSSSVVNNNDPWLLNDNDIGGATATTTMSNNDPWSSPDTTTDKSNKQFGTALNDPLKSLVNNGSSTTSSAVTSASTAAIRRTPESFLGPNSNLVNLDALVSSKVQTSATSPNNPFATGPGSSVSNAPGSTGGGTQAIINPFQANKPCQPTINELRAQTNHQLLAGASPVINNSSSNPSSSLTGALFQPQTTTGAFSTQGFTPIYPQLPNNSASVWGNFPSAFSSTTNTANKQSTSPQPNNPFAM